MLKKKAGFSLVEVMIWVTILGIIFGLVIRGAFKKPPLDHIPYFIRELNNATFFAQQEAVSTGQVLKLEFLPNSEGGCKLSLFEQGAQKESSWIVHKGLLSPANLTLESKIRISKLSKEENNKKTMSAQNEIVTYFFPSGFCEKIILELMFDDDGLTKKEVLYLNPFLCKFETKDLEE